MNKNEQIEEVSSFLAEVIQMMLDTLPDEDINAETILGGITSAALLDVYNIYKQGVSKKTIIEELQNEIKVHQTITDVLTGMLKETVILLEDDANYYTKETTNA